MDRVAANAGQAERQWDPDMVPDGQRRRPRLCEKEEPGLPVLFNDSVCAAVFAGPAECGKRRAIDRRDRNKKQLTAGFNRMNADGKMEKKGPLLAALFSWVKLQSRLI